MSTSLNPIIHVREGQAASSAFGSIEDWALAGVPLGDTERTSMWRIGDWYLLGAKLFGRGACKRIVEADGWTGPNYAVCRTAASIARRFPEVSRRLDIGFTHHQAVAAVHRTDTEAAYRLLDAAARERWTRNKIRIGWPPSVWLLHEDWRRYRHQSGRIDQSRASVWRDLD